MFLFLDSSVGTDSVNYLKDFNNISSKIPFDLVRSGYLLRVLFFIFKKMYLNFLQTKIIIINIFIVGIVFVINKIFEKERRLQIMFILFVNGFLLQYSSNTIKQGLSIVFVYIFFIYLEKNKIIAVLSSVIAILFHSSSVIGLLIILFFRKIKIKYNIYICIFLVSFFLGQNLNKLIKFILIYLDLSYYTRYFDEYVGGVSYNIFNVFEYQILMLILLVLDYKNKIKLSLKEEYLKNIFYIEILIINLLISQKQLISRITSFFALVNSLIIIIIINKIKNKSIRLFVYLLISSIFLFIRVLRVSSLDYKSWLWH